MNSEDEIMALMLHRGLGPKDSSTLSIMRWIVETIHDSAEAGWREMMGPPVDVRLFGKRFAFRPVVVRGRPALWVKAKASSPYYWVSLFLILPFSFLFHALGFLIGFFWSRVEIVRMELRGCYHKVKPDSTEEYLWRKHQADRPLDFQI
jgi:hypothetical protein